MSFSQNAILYFTIIPHIILIGYKYCDYDINLLTKEIIFLYSVNLFHFFCGAQWVFSEQTLSSKSKIIPLILVVLGTFPMIITLHSKLLSAALLLSILYILQLIYDLSSEISYCSQKNYKIGRVLSTLVILYTLGYLII
jgi:hypothetical protein